MLFFVQGNLPGRRDAGQIWGNAYALFLRGQGFLQSKVDRKVFYIRDRVRAGGHVDDMMMSVRDPVAGARFNLAWCERFGLNGAARAQRRRGARGVLSRPAPAPPPGDRPGR